MSSERRPQDVQTPAYASEMYEDLRRIAGRYIDSERADHTLQPTALIHEAYLKLAGRDDWKSATHYRAVASNAMRQILVDHARARNRIKRGGGNDRKRVLLTDSIGGDPSRDLEILALDEALTELGKLDDRKARVVELRFFGGLTSKEAAEILEVSHKTVEADWYFARAWLHERLGSDQSTDTGLG